MVFRASLVFWRTIVWSDGMRRMVPPYVAVAVVAATGIVVLALLFFRETRASPLVDAPVESECAQSAEPLSVSAGLAASKKYVVKQGDTISAIAAKYNLDAATLFSANPGLAEIIFPGQELVILPEKGILHIAESGDSLWLLSRVYGVEQGKIMAANNKDNANLALGEKIFIPGGKQPVRDGNPVSRAAGKRIVWPVNGEVTSGFGMRWGQLHAGIDIANEYGTPVQAAMAGCVTYAGWYGGYGNALVIEHGQGYSTLYGHLSGFAAGTGDYVQSGQTIAYLGSTGNSTGPHLHFEVRVNDSPVNPLSWLP